MRPCQHSVSHESHGDHYRTVRNTASGHTRSHKDHIEVELTGHKNHRVMV